MKHCSTKIIESYEILNMFIILSDKVKKSNNESLKDSTIVPQKLYGDVRINFPNIQYVHFESILSQNNYPNTRYKAAMHHH